MAIALAKSRGPDPNPDGLTEHGSRPMERLGRLVLRLDSPNHFPYLLGHSYLGSWSAAGAGEHLKVSQS
jgi:hypothetical protein